VEVDVGRLADWFGLQPSGFPGEGTPLERQMGDAGPIWSDIAQKHHFAEPDLNRVASVWHNGADLDRPVEVVTDMSKSRRLGFLDYQATDESFFQLFTTLREMRIIP
jgi:hypothetical protein